MSKRESIVYQVNHVLRQSYHSGYGRSRHADKQNAMNNEEQYDFYTKDKIYGQKTYKATNTTCIAFAKYCRDSFSIKYISDIRPEMFSGFIQKGDFKTGSKYDPKTAATYASQVTKLENAYNSQNNTNLVFVNKDYKQYLSVAEHKRDQMPREVHDQIIQKCYETKYTNGLALELARALGLRVREITNLRKEDFIFNVHGELIKVHIHRSKGGRNRDISASKLSIYQIQTVIKVYAYFNSITGGHDRLFTNQAESYEKALTRARDSISTDYIQCGVHSLRKEFAQDYYDKETGKGRIAAEVKQELTELLGHNRLQVLDYYLK